VIGDCENPAINTQAFNACQRPTFMSSILAAIFNASERPGRALGIDCAPEGEQKVHDHKKK
jgi:hypothetical protein